MRAWMDELDDGSTVFYHGVSGQDLDTLATYCRERGEVERQGSDMKLAASVEGTVIMDWCNKRGITWSRFMNDQGLLARFLDDPENACFRVWKGRI